MWNLRKLPVILSMAILLSVLIITSLAWALPAEAGAKNTISWVKAICSKNNYCIDVMITCENGRLTGIEPVPDGIYFPEAWDDPRPEDLLNKWC